MDGPRELEVEVGSRLRLAVEHWEPAGDPEEPGFLLVHGLASNARLWAGVAARLVAAGHRAVAVDLRGHGRSERPDPDRGQGFASEELCADLLDVLAATGLRRPVAVGQSWGGNVVVDLARRRPDALRGVVAIDGGTIEPSRSFPDRAAMHAALDPPRLTGRPVDELERQLRTAHPGWSDEAVSGQLANLRVRDDGTVEPRLGRDDHHRVLDELWRATPSQHWEQLQVPLVLLPVDTGDDDWTEHKRTTTAEAAARVARVRVRWLTGDHDVHAEAPGAVAAEILAGLGDGWARGDGQDAA